MFQSAWVVPPTDQCYTDSDSFADSDDNFSDEETRGAITDKDCVSVVAVLKGCDQSGQKPQAGQTSQAMDQSGLRTILQKEDRTSNPNDCSRNDISGTNAVQAPNVLHNARRRAFMSQSPTEFDALAIERLLRVRWVQSQALGMHASCIEDVPKFC